jgi:hypothetical protein
MAKKRVPVGENGVQSNNSECRNTGHHWRSTTSDRFRHCDRSGCGAVQRLVNGSWQDVTPVQRSRRSSRLTSKNWYESEYAMLNESHQPDYVDHAKAENDIRNYWR